MKPAMMEMKTRPMTASTTVGYPVAMGYIDSKYTHNRNNLFGELRGKRVPVKVSKIPFVPLNFKR